MIARDMTEQTYVMEWKSTVVRDMTEQRSIIVKDVIDLW